MADPDAAGPPPEFLEPAAAPAESLAAPQTTASSGFLPSRPPRATFESVLVRVIATAGVVGIGTAVGTLLETNGVDGWITALVVSLLSVLLAAVLWRSRRL